MEGELSIPRNLQALPDHVRGTDRISAATPKREGRPGKGRSFDLGAQRQADEELSSDGTPAEHDRHAADKHPTPPADGQAPSSPPAAGSQDSSLDYQA